MALLLYKLAKEHGQSQIVKLKPEHFKSDLIQKFSFEYFLTYLKTETDKSKIKKTFRLAQTLLEQNSVDKLYKNIGSPLVTSIVLSDIKAELSQPADETSDNQDVPNDKRIGDELTSDVVDSDEIDETLKEPEVTPDNNDSEEQVVTLTTGSNRIKTRQEKVDEDITAVDLTNWEIIQYSMDNDKAIPWDRVDDKIQAVLLKRLIRRLRLDIQVDANGFKTVPFLKVEDIFEVKINILSGGDSTYVRPLGEDFYDHWVERLELKQTSSDDIIKAIISDLGRDYLPRSADISVDDIPFMPRRIKRRIIQDLTHQNSLTQYQALTKAHFQSYPIAQVLYEYYEQSAGDDPTIDETIVILNLLQDSGLFLSVDPTQDHPSTAWQQLDQYLSKVIEDNADKAIKRIYIDLALLIDSPYYINSQDWRQIYGQRFDNHHAARLNIDRIEERYVAAGIAPVWLDENLPALLQKYQDEKSIEVVVVATQSQHQQTQIAQFNASQSSENSEENNRLQSADLNLPIVYLKTSDPEMRLSRYLDHADSDEADVVNLYVSSNNSDVRYFEEYEPKTQGVWVSIPSWQGDWQVSENYIEAALEEVKKDDSAVNYLLVQEHLINALEILQSESLKWEVKISRYRDIVMIMERLRNDAEGLNFSPLFREFNYNFAKLLYDNDLEIRQHINNKNSDETYVIKKSFEFYFPRHAEAMFNYYRLKTVTTDQGGTQTTRHAIYINYDPDANYYNRYSFPVDEYNAPFYYQPMLREIERRIQDKRQKGIDEPIQIIFLDTGARQAYYVAQAFLAARGESYQSDVELINLPFSVRTRWETVKSYRYMLRLAQQIRDQRVSLNDVAVEHRSLVERLLMINFATDLFVVDDNVGAGATMDDFRDLAFQQGATSMVFNVMNAFRRFGEVFDMYSTVAFNDVVYQGLPVHTIEKTNMEERYRGVIKSQGRGVLPVALSETNEKKSGDFKEFQRYQQQINATVKQFVTNHDDQIRNPLDTKSIPVTKRKDLLSQVKQRLAENETNQLWRRSLKLDDFTIQVLSSKGSQRLTVRRVKTMEDLRQYVQRRERRRSDDLVDHLLSPSQATYLIEDQAGRVVGALELLEVISSLNLRTTDPKRLRKRIVLNYVDIDYEQEVKAEDFIEALFYGLKNILNGGDAESFLVNEKVWPLSDNVELRNHLFKRRIEHMLVYLRSARFHPSEVVEDIPDVASEQFHRFVHTLDFRLRNFIEDPVYHASDSLREQWFSLRDEPNTLDVIRAKLKLLRHRWPALKDDFYWGFSLKEPLDGLSDQQRQVVEEIQPFIWTEDDRRLVDNITQAWGLNENLTKTQQVLWQILQDRKHFFEERQNQGTMSEWQRYFHRRYNVKKYQQWTDRVKVAWHLMEIYHAHKDKLIQMHRISQSFWTQDGMREAMGELVQHLLNQDNNQVIEGMTESKLRAWLNQQLPLYWEKLFDNNLGGFLNSLWPDVYHIDQQTGVITIQRELTKPEIINFLLPNTIHSQNQLEPGTTYELNNYKDGKFLIESTQEYAQQLMDKNSDAKKYLNWQNKVVLAIRVDKKNLDENQSAVLVAHEDPHLGSILVVFKNRDEYISWVRQYKGHPILTLNHIASKPFQKRVQGSGFGQVQYFEIIALSDTDIFAKDVQVLRQSSTNSVGAYSKFKLRPHAQAWRKSKVIEIKSKTKTFVIKVFSKLTNTMQSLKINAQELFRDQSWKNNTRVQLELYYHKQLRQVVLAVYNADQPEAGPVGYFIFHNQKSYYLSHNAVIAEQLVRLSLMESPQLQDEIHYIHPEKVGYFEDSDAYGIEIKNIRGETTRIQGLNPFKNGYVTLIGVKDQRLNETIVHVFSGQKSKDEIREKWHESNLHLRLNPNTARFEALNYWISNQDAQEFDAIMRSIAPIKVYLWKTMLLESSPDQVIDDILKVYNERLSSNIGQVIPGFGEKDFQSQKMMDLIYDWLRNHSIDLYSLDKSAATGVYRSEKPSLVHAYYADFIQHGQRVTREQWQVVNSKNGQLPDWNELTAMLSSTDDEMMVWDQETESSGRILTNMDRVMTRLIRNKKLYRSYDSEDIRQVILMALQDIRLESARVGVTTTIKSQWSDLERELLDQDHSQDSVDLIWQQFFAPLSEHFQTATSIDQLNVDLLYISHLGLHQIDTINHIIETQTNPTTLGEVTAISKVYLVGDEPGTGKTTTAYGAAVSLPMENARPPEQRRIVAIMPSRRVAKQTVQEWAKRSPKKHYTFVVDETSGHGDLYFGGKPQQKEWTLNDFIEQSESLSQSTGAPVFVIITRSNLRGSWDVLFRRLPEVLQQRWTSLSGKIKKDEISEELYLKLKTSDLISMSTDDGLLFKRISELDLVQKLTLSKAELEFLEQKLIVKKSTSYPSGYHYKNPREFVGALNRPLEGSEAKPLSDAEVTKATEALKPAFDQVLGRIRALVDWDYDVLIADEAHEDQNKSLQSFATQELATAAKFSIAATGTPKLKKEQLYRLFHVFDPDLFNETTKEAFFQGIDAEGLLSIDRLYSRKTFDMLGKVMPDIKIKTETIEMSDWQRVAKQRIDHLVGAAHHHAELRISSGVEEIEEADKTRMLFHFDTLKIKKIEQRFKEALEKSERVVIGFQSHDVGRALALYLRIKYANQMNVTLSQIEKNIWEKRDVKNGTIDVTEWVDSVPDYNDGFLYIDGTLSEENRKTRLDQFNNGSPFLMISYGLWLGVNGLQEADVRIFAETPDWTHELRQLKNRFLRLSMLGQSNDEVVIDLFLPEGLLDHDLYDAHLKHEALSRSRLDRSKKGENQKSILSILDATVGMKKHRDHLKKVRQGGVEFRRINDYLQIQGIQEAGVFNQPWPESMVDLDGMNLKINYIAPAYNLQTFLDIPVF